jgi:GDP-mannose transporter
MSGGTQQEMAASKMMFAVVGYATCSSLMLVMNKVAVHVLPAPSFVLLCQLFSSWAAVKLVGCCGCIVVDDLEWNKLKAFLPVSMAFLACIFANIKTLQYANVETFVVFRASTPLFISLCDYAFLGRELPNMRSTACLVALLFAALGYVLTDATYHVKGYMWVAGWYAIFCFDQVYIKHAVDSVPVESNWGRVFYTNFWASLIMAVSTVATEPEVLLATAWTPATVGALSVSCLLGVAMSYFAFLCRAAVSATSFTVIGNVCKVLTVLINVFIWDKHASKEGLGFLFFCLAAAYFYKQAPMRSTSNEESEQLKPLAGP